MAPVYLGYRRTVVMAGIAAAVVLVGSAVLGHPAVGVLVAVGFALGAWNANRVREMAPRVLPGGVLDRRGLGRSGAKRLGYVTLLVILIAIGFRPHGWTVVIGLAAFQLLLVANTVGPLLREVRRG